MFEIAIYSFNVFVRQILLLSQVRLFVQFPLLLLLVYGVLRTVIVIVLYGISMTLLNLLRSL